MNKEEQSRIQRFPRYYMNKGKQIEQMNFLMKYSEGRRKREKVGFMMKSMFKGLIISLGLLILIFGFLSDNIRDTITGIWSPEEEVLHDNPFSLDEATELIHEGGKRYNFVFRTVKSEEKKNEIKILDESVNTKEKVRHYFAEIYSERAVEAFVNVFSEREDGLYRSASSYPIEHRWTSGESKNITYEGDDVALVTYSLRVPQKEVMVRLVFENGSWVVDQILQ